MDIFEAMESCRAIRRLKPDPVADELLERLVHYATRAPSAGNAQLWGFLIVTDPDERRFVGDLLREAWAPRLPKASDDDAPGSPGAIPFREFVMNFDRAPAIIFTCVENAYPAQGEPNPIFMWSTVYTATQNLLLAARALGLGAAMTTFHIVDEAAIKERFGIPEAVSIGATIPVGHPAGRYGPLNRRPSVEVTHWNRWGASRKP